MTPARERLVCVVLLINAVLMWAVADRHVALRDGWREAELVGQANAMLEERRTDRISWPVDSQRR